MISTVGDSPTDSVQAYIYDIIDVEQPQMITIHGVILLQISYKAQYLIKAQWAYR